MNTCLFIQSATIYLTPIMCPVMSSGDTMGNKIDMECSKGSGKRVKTLEQTDQAQILIPLRTGCASLGKVLGLSVS